MTVRVEDYMFGLPGLGAFSDEREKMSPFLDKQSGTALKIEQQRQFEEHQKQLTAWNDLQQRVWKLGQAGAVGMDTGNISQAQEPNRVERETERAMKALEHAVSHIERAVAAIDERTRAIQIIRPEEVGAPVRECPSSQLAGAIDRIAKALEEQADRLIDLEQRIQL